MAPPRNGSPYAPGSPQWLLLQAAVHGDLPQLKRMVKKLDDGRGRLAEAVDAVRESGAGALHIAALCGHPRVCRYLVDKVGVDVNSVDFAGQTPLFCAVRHGSVDTIRYLLDHDANPDKLDKSGFAPLHEATKEGKCEIVELLLSKGACADLFSTNHGTPLHVAAEHSQDGPMKVLLDHHADCNKLMKSFISPLVYAIHSCSQKCVTLLMEAGADVKGARPVTPLLVAATKGLTDILKCLLEAGAEPNIRNEFGHLPIQLAAYFGTREDVEILFPVTSSRIQAVDDWSVDGIISCMKSEPTMENHPLAKMSIADLKQEGSKAIKRGDYFAAVEFYSMAMHHDPIDPILLGNRSFCKLRMGQGANALMDAELCRSMLPNCPKACWLQGCSFVLLKDYKKACDAFLDGLKLVPADVDMKMALRDTLKFLRESHATKNDSKTSVLGGCHSVTEAYICTSGEQLD